MTEAQLHRAVAAFLRVALRPPTIWTTIGHGGGGRLRGAQLKAMGVQKGWPDIIVAHYYPSLDYTGAIGIELKVGKNGQSAEQKAVEASFTAVRWDYAVCRSVEEVHLALAHALIPLHASVMGSGTKVAA